MDKELPAFSYHRWAGSRSEDFETQFAELLKVLERIAGPWKQNEVPLDYNWTVLDDAIEKLKAIGINGDVSTSTQ